MKLAYVMAALALSVVACGSGKDSPDTPPVVEDPSMQLSTATLTVPSSNGTSVIDVTTNRSAWTVSSDASWLTVSKTSDGKGINVSYQANEDMGRAATITANASGATATCRVRQEANPEAVLPYDANIAYPEGYQLVWREEFDQDGEPSDQWSYETGAGGWGNNEIQNYVEIYAPDGTPMANAKDGILTITCDKIDGTVYSIRMNTKKAWTYGWFEARLKLPKGKGTWPAFWMMPKNYKTWPGDGEIDIMEEVGYNPNYVSSSIHCNAYNHVQGTQRTSERLIEGAQDDFHVYALEWTPDAIRSYVDGVLLFQFANDGRGDYDTWPFFNHFYLKINLAWGGNWGGAMGLDESCLPAKYEIDYVRVFQKDQE